MLVPAICYKDELLKKFAAELYTDKYFYYAGMGHDHEFPVIDDVALGVYKYAIVSNDDKLVGYFAYRVYVDIDSVENFGLYSFDDPDYSLMRNALSVGRDVFAKLEELVENHHRLSWRVIDGNPVISSYDAFCKRHSGRRVTLHDVTKDNKGIYHDEHIYEIVKGREFSETF